MQRDKQNKVAIIFGGDIAFFISIVYDMNANYGTPKKFGLFRILIVNYFYMKEVISYDRSQEVWHHRHY